MQTVKLARDPEVYPEPHMAEAHPDEVENYRLGGWVPVETESAPKRGRPKKEAE